MHIACETKSCGNVFVVGLQGEGMIYGHRSYGFARALAIHCELCGAWWTRPGFRVADLCPNPLFATLRCPSPQCRGSKLGQVAHDHALLVHRGRTTICQGLQYVSCDKCGHGFDVSIAPSAAPGRAPVVTLTASS